MMKEIFACVFLAIFGASIGSTIFFLFQYVTTFNANARVTRQLVETNTELYKALNKVAKHVETFEATGYSTKVRDDGKVEITFLKYLGKKHSEDSEKDEDWAETRTIILPAWMWAQVTAEAALKLGFEALEKKEEKQKEKTE